MIESKKVFIDPTFEIVELYVADVITTSGEDGGETGGDNWLLPEL